MTFIKYYKIVTSESDKEQTELQLQKLARHEMICKLLADIRADMEICRLKGWDKMEYIREIYSEMNRFIKLKR